MPCDRAGEVAAADDQPPRHEPLADDRAAVVDVVDEVVQRGDPLDQAPLDDRPFVSRDEPRDEVERERPVAHRLAVGPRLVGDPLGDERRVAPPAGGHERLGAHRGQRPCEPLRVRVRRALGVEDLVGVSPNGLYAGRLALGIVATPSFSPASDGLNLRPEVESRSGIFACSVLGARQPLPARLGTSPRAEAALGPVERVDERDLALDLVDVGDRGQALLVVPARSATASRCRSGRRSRSRRACAGRGSTPFSNASTVAFCALVELFRRVAHDDDVGDRRQLAVERVRQRRALVLEQRLRRSRAGCRCACRGRCRASGRRASGRRRGARTGSTRRSRRSPRRRVAP